MAVTSRDRDDDADRETPPVPWHNRTSMVLGASVAALAAIALIVTSVSYVARQFSEPTQAPINYVGPFTSTENGSATPTTTGTITSTRPPVTTDINPDLAPPPETSPPESPSRNPNLRPPRTREDEPGDSETRTTRNRPRTNVTRTLYPAP